jgi:hypothetical protein
MCNRPTVKNLRGIDLRYVLTWHLALHGRASIAELVEVLAFHGFEVDDPAGKSISDALRWERRRGGVPPRVGCLRSRLPAARHRTPDSSTSAGAAGRSKSLRGGQTGCPELAATDVTSVTAPDGSFWLMTAVHGMVVGDPPKTVGHRAIG